MKEHYNKTNWVDNKTPVNAENLNNIENGISHLFDNAISQSEITEGSGITLAYSKSGIHISLGFREVEEAPTTQDSMGQAGDYYIDAEKGYIYFCINGLLNENQVTTRWIKLRLEAFDK